MGLPPVNFNVELIDFLKVGTPSTILLVHSGVRVLQKWNIMKCQKGSIRDLYWLYLSGSGNCHFCNSLATEYASHFSRLFDS